MVLQASVILSTGGGVCLSACWDTHPLPPEQTPPWEQTPPGSRHPSGSSHPPGSRHPQSRHPPEQTPLTEQTPPNFFAFFCTHPPSQWEADSGIRSTSGGYASYWNAFLFLFAFISIICGRKNTGDRRANKSKKELTQKKGKLEFFLDEFHWIQRIRSIMTKSKNDTVSKGITWLLTDTFPSNSNIFFTTSGYASIAMNHTQ